VLRVRKADNLAAIYEPIVKIMWYPSHLTTLWASTACKADSFTFYLFSYSQFKNRSSGTDVSRSTIVLVHGIVWFLNNVHKRKNLNDQIYLILPAAQDPRIHSASNRYEYQKQKNNVSGE
jgi:hypothetical protein